MCWHVLTPSSIHARCVCCHWIKPAAYRRPRPGIWPRCVSNKESYSHGQLHLGQHSTISTEQLSPFGLLRAWFPIATRNPTSVCYKNLDPSSQFMFGGDCSSFQCIMHAELWILELSKMSKIKLGPFVPKRTSVVVCFQNPSERSGQLVNFQPDHQIPPEPSLR